jgi:putative copper export protein
MVWVLAGLQLVHVLGGIFWFGSLTMTLFFVLPALRSLPLDAQMTWQQAMSRRYGRIIGPVAALTILLGIGLGIAEGVLNLLGTAYGVTWLAAIVLGGAVAASGARLTGPAAGLAADEHDPERFSSLLTKLHRYGRLEFGGMMGLVVLMVAMRFGY